MRVFFDDYPLFYETSSTAMSPTRLGLRHQAMIGANQDILDGARVLDLASHDGRWSFAALKAGAAHVTGVEARRPLVRKANETFAAYGVDEHRYDFIAGDMFEVLANREFKADVVVCFGFIYHTLRYPDLFKGIVDAQPQHLVLDTKIALGDEPYVRLLANRTKVQSHAAKDNRSHGDRVIAGWPSLPALHMLLDVYDFDVEQQYDWPALLEAQSGRGKAAHDYATGQRVTLRCRAR
ncbi:MAG: methyltransferase domain-containing protein [Nocardioidaceae bacterium]